MANGRSQSWFGILDVPLSKYDLGQSAALSNCFPTCAMEVGV